MPKRIDLDEQGSIVLIGPNGEEIATLSSITDTEHGIIGIALDFKGEREVKANGQDIDGEINNITVALLSE